MTTDHCRRRIAVWCLASTLGCVMLFHGCGRSYPRMETYEAVQLIAALRTACSSQNAQRLERAATIIEQEFQAGALSEPQYQALRDVIATAEAGNWKDAEQMCHRFQKAQIR